MPRLVSLFVLGLTVHLATAQAPPRRPLEHRDSDSWNTATGMTLSPDGKWIAYLLTPPTGDAAVVIRNTETGTETRLPTRGRPPETAAETTSTSTPAPPPEPAAAPTPAGGPQFAPDSRLLLVPLIPPVADQPQKAPNPAAAPPQPTLAIYDLAVGKVLTRLERVRGFSIAGIGAGFVVYQVEPRPIDDRAIGAVLGALVTPPGVRPKPPAELRVRSLQSGAETAFPGVTDYTVAKDQTLLLAASGGATARVIALTLPAEGGDLVPPRELVAAAGRFSRFTWNDTQTLNAFFHTPTGQNTPRILLWKRTAATAKEVVPLTAAGLPPGHRIAERSGLNFSLDDEKLAFFTAPAPAATATPTAAETPPPAPAPGPARPGRRAPTSSPSATPAARPADPNAVDLDLWHWKDDAIQPMQKLRAAVERNRTFRAVCFLATRTVRPLSTPDLDVPVANFGDWAVASSDKPYRGQLWRSPLPRDYTLVNIRTGEQKPLLTAFDGSVVAPFSDYALTFDGTDWSSHRLPDGQTVNLTARLGRRFDNEDFDQPTRRPAYGVRGWTLDRKHVVVADRHDLWKLALDGSIAVNLTRIGKDQNIRFDFVPLDPDFSALALDLSKPWLLAAENLQTRDAGFYRLTPDGPPTLLTMAPRRFSRPTLAKKADTLLLTAQTFADYPDYYVADQNFRQLKQVTDIQPRTREFNWGTAELVNYTTSDGQPLQGVLIKPQDFDPQKKYPLIVYLYERLSNTVHTHRLPTAGTSINPTYYASNGYLILMPDISYTIGAPGLSAMKCVLPAVQAVADRGYVGPVGIQGHSWGGYQAAYLVTQTRRFAAAAAGAPVSNMVSAYGGVRWGSGMPRQFQYEQTQSRIGKTLWETPTKYIENSPIFYADKVETPLLMLHNDQDDAVPWYQGIEFYLALRRLGKEVYLLNYVGQPHGLRKKSAQRDYTVRMQQFFDHHLKGAPAPAWMRDGVPYTERDTEKKAIQELFGPAAKP